MGTGSIREKNWESADDIVAIEIGGESIQLIGDDLLHWRRQSFGSIPMSLRDFPIAKAILIAARTTPNEHCLLDFAESLKLSSGFVIIGTCQETWKESERQAGLQAGQYVTIQVLSTWAKTGGTTMEDTLRYIKPRQLSISLFEQFWGVHVSLCTGIARRVELREILADMVVSLMETRFVLQGGRTFGESTKSSTTYADRIVCHG